MEIQSGTLELSADNYNVNSKDMGWITLSYHNTTLEDHDPEEVLFNVVVRAKENSSSVELFDLTSKLTKAEAYRGYKVIVDLKVDNRMNETVAITSVNPNPWITSTTIQFVMPEQGKGMWEFYDVNGRLLHKLTETYKAGKQELVFDREDLKGSGAVYLKLTTDQGVAEYKMILVD